MFDFVVEDGTGLANATSYTTVEEADAYLAMNIHAAQNWEAQDVATKEKLLAWASKYLDQHARWYGRKAVEASALRWPRVGVRDRDNVLLEADAIPRQLKLATAEMARYLVDQDRSVERDQDALTRLRADVVELEFSEGYRLPQIPSHMQYVIQGLGTLGGGPSRFKRIIR